MNSNLLYPFKPSVGVVIGRFQVPELTVGHKSLIDYARARHPQVLILVGWSRSLPCSHDPIPEYVRTRSLTRQLEGSFPNDIVIMPLANHRTNEVWSKQVDEQIEKAFGDVRATIYGSRDSCLPAYSGQHETWYVHSAVSPSGRFVRSQLKFSASPDFLSGMIFAQQIRPALSYQAVDIAVVKDADVLLGRKNDDPEGTYRFPGGFVDPKDVSIEAAAHRELWEEVGMIEVGPMQYRGSRRINDWRYRSSADKVMSSFFVAPYVFGAIKAGDDLDEVRWMPISTAKPLLLPEHQQLFDLLDLDEVVFGKQEAT